MAELDFDKGTDVPEEITEETTDTKDVDVGAAESGSEEDYGSDTEEAQGEDFEALAAADLNEIRREFQEARGLTSITELDNPIRFAELRELGLSVREAYLATQKRRRTDNRSHLSGVAPRGAASPARSMTSSELSRARELFIGMSDAEIQSLYKRVSRQ